MNPRCRDRVTIDLRGIGPRLQAHAAAHRMTTAAAVVTMLNAEAGAEKDVDNASAPTSFDAIDARPIKVTLRLRLWHAASLADRARSTGVSQGTYVAGLLDGIPPSPRATDHWEAVAALVDSTQKVAAMSVDLNALTRAARTGSVGEWQMHSGRLASMPDELRRHLGVASRLIAAMTPARHKVPAAPVEVSNVSNLSNKGASR